MTRLPLFAVCAPGLEDITRAELFSLGINHPRAVPGGVEFEGFLSHLYKVNLWSRTASRVLARLGEFNAVSFAELRRKAAELPWENFLHRGAGVAIRAACHKSKLYHSDAVAERVALALQDRLGSAPPLGTRGSEDPEETLSQQDDSHTAVVVRFDRDHCTVSLDSSGAHLHRRGYRLAAAKAPLRETLAAALLRHAAYDSSQPLLDPFCGAGTFVIEAALMARSIAPGRLRQFAFMRWRNFDREAWHQQLRHAAAAVIERRAAIHASDRDEGAVAAARANAERAGVADAIQFRVCAISSVEPPAAAGLLISNLPYGRRPGKDARNLYAQLGQVARSRLRGWRAGILAGSMPLASAAGLNFGPPLWIENGGLRVPFLQTTVP